MKERREGGREGKVKQSDESIFKSFDESDFSSEGQAHLFVRRKNAHVRQIEHHLNDLVGPNLLILRTICTVQILPR